MNITYTKHGNDWDRIVEAEARAKLPHTEQREEISQARVGMAPTAVVQLSAAVAPLVWFTTFHFHFWKGFLQLITGGQPSLSQVPWNSLRVLQRKTLRFTWERKEAFCFSLFDDMFILACFSFCMFFFVVVCRRKEENSAKEPQPNPK